MKISSLLKAFIFGVIISCYSVAHAQRPVFNSAAQEAVGAGGGGCTITIFSMDNCPWCEKLAHEVFIGGNPESPSPKYACNKLEYVHCSGTCKKKPCNEIDQSKCVRKFPGGCWKPDEAGKLTPILPCTDINGTTTMGYNPNPEPPKEPNKPKKPNKPIQDQCTCPTPTPTTPPVTTSVTEAPPPPQPSNGNYPCTDVPFRCDNPRRDVPHCCQHGCDTRDRSRLSKDELNNFNECLKATPTPTNIPTNTPTVPPPPSEKPKNVVCDEDGCRFVQDGSPNPFLPPVLPGDKLPDGQPPAISPKPADETEPNPPPAPSSPEPACKDETCPEGQKCNDAGKCAPSQPQVVPPYSDTAQPSDCPPATSCDALKCDPSKTTCTPGVDERGCPINICAALPPSVLVTPSPGGKCSGDRLTKLCEAPNKASWTCCLPTERCVTNGSGLATCQP